MRLPRERSRSGIYHVVTRGINRQDIFFDDEDYQRFLITVDRMKSDGQFSVYAYCLMTNHVHLIIHEKSNSISRIMSRIGTSYAWWYNQKYGRSGHVFQGRYKSECVENDYYLLTAVRYIHNNPVQAGIVHNPEDYLWSSMRTYYGTCGDHMGNLGDHLRNVADCVGNFAEPSFVLGIINPDKEKAIVTLKEFMKIQSQDKFLEYDNRIRKTDNEVKTEIERLMNGEPIGALQRLERRKRNEVLRKIKAEEGVSLRQISRVTGLSVDVIHNA